MKQPVEGASPIAADGGFGPMDSEDTEDEDVGHEQGDTNVHANADDGFGEGFDDFEAGTEDEDFGDFDEGVEESSAPDEEHARAEPSAQPVHSLPSSATSFVRENLFSLNYLLFTYSLFASFILLMLIV